MKRAKLLIAAVVASMLLVGVGYAWWSDAITFVGTVSSGTVNVHFVDDSDYTRINASSTVIQREIVSETAKAVTTKFDNLYPGAVIWVDMKAKNESTIPVKIKTVNVTLAGDTAALTPYMTAAAYFYKTDTNDVFVPNSDYSTNPVPISQFQTELNNSPLKDLVLQPGETLYFDVPAGGTAPDLNGDGIPESCVIFRLEPNAPADVQGKSITVSIGADWKQFNQ